MCIGNGLVQLSALPQHCRTQKTDFFKIYVKFKTVESEMFWIWASEKNTLYPYLNDYPISQKSRINKFALSKPFPPPPKVSLMKAPELLYHSTLQFLETAV